MSEDIERRIDQLLALDGLSAEALSRLLFGPGGLFNQLASTETERRAVAQSPLFQRANNRLTELERRQLGELTGTGTGKSDGKVNGAASAPTERPAEAPDL